jgi:hypothetical protein
MLPFIGPLLGIGEKIIDKIWPDPEKAAAAKVQLMQMAAKGELDDMKVHMQAIVAEAKSEHTITATWRPITMLTFVFIIANNYILAPYINLFAHVDVTLALPPQMWDLLKIGLGGYVVGRSVEKAAGAFKGK